jgi:hypothetical protein
MSVNQIDELKRENLCLRQKIQRLQRARLVKVIHHPVKSDTYSPRTKTRAWDEYIYECN